MATFGVTLIAPSGVVVESVDFESKADFKQLIGSDGTHYQALTYDHTVSFNASGKGDACPYAAGDAVPSPGGGGGGKSFITTATENSKNDDFRGWSASGIIYPHAS